MALSPQSCDLCGLPLRRRSIASAFADKTFHFCCNGCKQVFQMLAEKHGAGDPGTFKESELFKKCRDLGVIPKSEADLAQREKAGTGEEIPPIKGERTLSLRLRVKGMWCPACAWLIEESLKKNRGISDVQCIFSSDRLRCDFDPVSTSPSKIIASIGALGYEAFLPEESGQSKERQKEIIRLAVSALLTMNVMMFSFGVYTGFFSDLSSDTITKLSWPMFIMASIVLFYGGRKIYQKAWAGVTSASFGMETLITCGAFSAYIYSAYHWAMGSIHLYFDTACMLIVLVLLGKSLEAGAKRKVQEDLDALLSARPSKVRIIGPGNPEGRYVPVEELRPGDMFQVEEGGVVPADGRILTGKGSVDEAPLTGEAIPVVKAPGDDLRSGTRVIQGIFTARAERVGEESFIGQVLRIIERTLRDETPFEGKTDRLLRWFVPLVLVLAAGTGFVCMVRGLPAGEALIRGVTVLVISCPCTLGIAVPLARVAGVSLAAKNGILVREFSSFEQAQGVNAFVFDKTGTVTQGKWKLLKTVTTGPFTEEQVLAQAGSLESESDHYIARELSNKKGHPPDDPLRVRGIEKFDNGISGYVGEHRVRIGSRDFLKDETEMSNPGVAQASSGSRPGCSTVFMATDGKLSALFLFGDEIRKGSSRAIRELRAMGCRVILLSGDGDDTTKAVGREVGIDEAYGGKLPQEKAALIQELRREGYRVAMVGDGINDAPALVQADLGIAVSSGNELGKEAGDITLMRGDLGQILDFLGLAKGVCRKIRQNLFFSGLYNIIAIPVAMAGLLNPLIAVSAMLFSSLSVIGNTLLLVRCASETPDEGIEGERP